MWPAIIRTVLLGAPGTVAPHSSWGKFSKRKAVTRLLVLHASSSMFRWSSADCITTLPGVIQTDAERQLTGRGDYIQPSVQSSCEMRSRRSGPTICDAAYARRQAILSLAIRRAISSCAPSRLVDLPSPQYPIDDR